MRSSLRPSRSRLSRPASRGTTLMGFIAGLLTGLLLAVAVALYITNAPVPFVTKVQRPTDTVAPGGVDPNKGLNPSAGAPPAASGAPAASAGDPKAAVPPGSAANAAPPPASASAPAKTSDLDDAGRFLLQAGAFKSAEEAEAMRARLGMLGMDARVVERQAEGGSGKLYRVRLGPYGRVEDVDRIRKLLTENGIEAQLVKMR